MTAKLRSAMPPQLASGQYFEMSASWDFATLALRIFIMPSQDVMTVYELDNSLH